MASVVCTLRDHQDDINWCAFSAKLLATCSGDKTLRIYNAEDFSELPFSPLKGHGYSVHCCCFSPCGQLLVSCSTDATAVVWSTVTGDIEAVLEHPGRSPVRICALSPNAAHLVSGASDGTLALWDFHSKRLTGGVRDTTMVACSFSPCSQMFMTGSTYGDLRLWDLHLNQLLAKKDAHDLGVSCCSFAPIILSNQVVQFRLASCGQDYLLLYLAGFDMVLLHTLTGQTAPVFCCAYSSDGQLLVSGSVDKSVKVYDAVKHSLGIIHVPDSLRRYVTACAFHPTSPLIATGSMDKTVNVCRLEDGRRGEERAKNHTIKRKAVAGRSKLLVADWSEGDVSEWLVEEGLQGLVDKFKANNIDGTELLSLTKETLASELGIESVGLRGKLLRKVEELKSDSMSSGVPDEFLCPITRELMREPVIAADGYSYEREAIENWIHTKNRSSPMTNLPLLTTLLTPNHTLKMAISRWKTSQ
uniref:WD repeat, SAM and U-box domain-containing protein 1 n=1 Tax=Poecilia reticulata TaxID=8081 RepID=A0A3P9Q9J7_POERE